MTEELLPKDMPARSTGPNDEQLDVAGKSLAEALRISFFVLKMIMLVMAGLFLVSGIFRVRQNEQALVLWLGRIGGAGALKPGLKWAFPEPICEIIKIPVTDVQTLSIDSLWYFETEQEKLGQKSQFFDKVLDPLRDGYCLTRSSAESGTESTDYNIVHSKWQLKYRISRPENFFRNIYCRKPMPGQQFIESARQTIEPLLEAVATNAVVAAMTKYTIDQAIVSTEKIPLDVAAIVQEKLDLMDSGITVESMQISGRITWPRQVDQAFLESNKAKQESDSLISQARTYAATILNQTAGANAETVLERLKDTAIGEQDRLQLLSSLSGQCGQIINRALADRAVTVQTAKARAEYFSQLLPQYRQRPGLVIQKLCQDAVQQVFQMADEKILVTASDSDEPKELRININRDPAIRKKQSEKQ